MSRVRSPSPAPFAHLDLHPLAASRKIPRQSILHFAAGVLMGQDVRLFPSRRRFLRAGLATGLATAAYPTLGAAHVFAQQENANVTTREFELDELTIDVLQQGMQSGKYTSRGLVEKYLARIQEIDKAGPRINSVIEVNPGALEIAEAVDRERKERGPRGPLHGVPLLIKDNIDTLDRMNTTAGSLALLGSTPPKDAFVVSQLRNAGAVILGKTNL